jgi:hypothetical protein
MTAATPIATTDHSLPSPLSGSARYSTSVQLEVAKCLQLVVPASMSADDRAAWIMAAVDALEDIRADEVQAVSAELRRSVTRPAQIVPEIAKLVAEKRHRARSSSAEPSIGLSLWQIDREAERRRKEAHTQTEVEAAWRWERSARQDAGLHVPPIQPPLTPAELHKMPPHIRSLGIARGLLEYRDGQLVEILA